MAVQGKFFVFHTPLLISCFLCGLLAFLGIEFGDCFEQVWGLNSI
jgi:hypothetical protein